jgi:release factor glutamine methyltransferase
VLDVGCGSGVLAIVAARAGAVVTAIDINVHAVETTRSNAIANGVDVDALQSDLYTELRGRRFDLVVVNPPYFAKDPTDDAERAWFAGADLGYFERFFAGLGEHLVDDGVVLMVLSEGCDMTTIDAAAKRHGFAMEVARRRRVWLGYQVVWTITSSGSARP